MVYDSIGAAWAYKSVPCGAVFCRDSMYVQQPNVTRYTASGDRLSDTVSNVVVGQVGPSYDDRYYYYDALGRTTGIIHFDQYQKTCDASRCWYPPQGGANDCLYDVEGRMVRACGAGADVAYDGPNVSATNQGVWHFMHGPGVDDPLLGIGQQVRGTNEATKEFYWVTDGQGRQYAMAESDGFWDAQLDPANRPGFLQAGGITDARGYNASRSQGSSVPGVSYFRNRIYDQGSGQWTQEDPIGLAGGQNLYQYAGANPVTNTDPFGLCPCIVAAAPVAIAVAPEVIAGAAALVGVAAGTIGENAERISQAGAVAGTLVAARAVSILNSIRTTWTNIKTAIGIGVGLGAGDQTPDPRHRREDEPPPPGPTAPPPPTQKPYKIEQKPGEPPKVKLPPEIG